MVEQSERGAQEKEQQILLLDTLRNIWQNYGKVPDDMAAKYHWVELLIYNLQFVDETTQQQDEFISFFNPIPEELCAFLLEQVYEIITKSNFYSPNMNDSNSSDEYIGDHNFAQLILEKPSDCSKIIALRTFLTRKIGHHVLQLMLRSDIRLITSQKSLCNLCINLFPNCPWSDNQAELENHPKLFQFIGNLNLYQRPKPKHTLIIKSPSRTRPTKTKLKQECFRNFDDFKRSSKESDEIANILAQLLINCVSHETDKTLIDQSVSVVALNFAMDCLRCVENHAFGTARNALVIKSHLLNLIETCLNNIFASEEGIKIIQFEYVFAKLAAALENNKTLDIDATHENAQILCALNFLIVGTLHNVITIYLSYFQTGHSSSSTSDKHNLYSVKFIDQTVIGSCIQTLYQVLQSPDAEMQILISIIFKTLIKVIDNLYRYDQLVANSCGSTLSGSGAVQHKPRRHKTSTRQIHCRSIQPALVCQFQSMLVCLLPRFTTELQEYAVRYLLRIGTCCCQYNFCTINVCLTLAPTLSAAYQKCTYKFVYRRILSTIFVRNFTATNKKKESSTCECDMKMKSIDFHVGLLQIYRQAYLELPIIANNFVALSTFLKHMKHISHLLTNDIGAGVLAIIVLPAFRQFKTELMKRRKNSVEGTTSKSSSHNNACERTSETSPRPSTSSAASERPTSSSRINASETTSATSSIYLNSTRNNVSERTSVTLRNIASEMTSATSSRFTNSSRNNAAERTSATLPRSTNSSRNNAAERTSATLPKISSAHKNLHLHIITPAWNFLNSDTCSLRILHECLNIFVSYMSDIRLIKAFFIEENIKHLEDLLTEPELIRGACDLIKIGIDNITFLGENIPEQKILSSRLITLQLNTSDRAAQLFHELLARFAKCSRRAREQFWFDEDPKTTPAQQSKLKPMDILHIAAFQWSLNYDLLKTSQLFYNEFARVYSIVVEEDVGDDEPEVNRPNGVGNLSRRIFEDPLTVRTEVPTTSQTNLKHGDKTIIDILKLNYNSLCSFLLLPHKKSQLGNNTNDQQHIYTLKPQRASENLPPCIIADNAIDCFSSSLEALISSVNLSTQQLAASASAPQYSISSSATSTASTATTAAYETNVFGRAWSEVDSQYNNCVSQFYVENNNETFLQKLLLQELQQQQQQQQQQNANHSPLMAESIVLFNIRNQIHSNETSFTSTSQGLNVKTVLADPRNTHQGLVHSPGGGSVEGSIIGKLFSVFGSFFGVSRSNSNIDLDGTQKREQEEKIDEDLRSCFYEPNEDCKKLCLKLFEATMAICVKGYQNEEVEKMQKHLRKLKATILSNASSNWQQTSEEHVRENAIVETLQTLLKLAELSNTMHEPVAVVSSSILTTATEDVAAAARPLPARILNSSRPQGMGTYQSQLLFPTLSANNAGAAITPTSPTISHPRPYSGESGDGDYFSTRASVICPDSEVEFSENEDYYMTADEGYEADAEIPELSDSAAEIEATELWNCFQPTSRYRTHVLHDGLCRLVVEILIELSTMCTRNPVGWSDSLAQLANRLFVIREYLGGPLVLLRGFAPVLSCNDVRLKELQQSILELITDLNTPDVLCAFFSILAAKNPPMDILIKCMSYISASSLRKSQPSVELEFPVTIDGKCVSTGDSATTEQIDRVRNYHLHCQATTPFTRSPCIIPITHTRVWSNDGFTLSLWLQVKGSQTHKSSSQQIEEDTRSTSEDYMKSHIVSIGSNQAMLSIYINCNMNLVFETCKPNAEIQMRTTQAADDFMEASTSAMAASSTADARQTSRTGRISHVNLQNMNTATTSLAAGTSPFRNVIKQTKQVILNSFSNMHLFNGQPESGTNFESSSVDLKHFRMSRNKWTHLTFAVDTLPDSLDLTVYIDGLETHVVSLPFRNLRNLTRTHVFQMVSLGDASNNYVSYTESGSTLDSFTIRHSISNLMLFNRKIAVKDAILNLTAMGPDFNELTLCQVGNRKPNYGYLNLNKMNSANFGNFGDSMKLLKKACSLTYSAQQPDLVMAYDANNELDNAACGRPCGLLLYGQLMQNQLNSLQTATILSGGLSTLLHLFARVVETSNNSASQSMALDLLLSTALSESQLYAEFLRNDYISLIGYVIKTERCTKDVHLLKSIVNNACTQALINKKGDNLQVNENTSASLVYPRLIVSILHRYSDWHRSGAEHSEVLDMLFQCILALTREKHPHRDFNMEQLNKAGLIKELLNLCKVYVIESPNPVCISKSAAVSFVSILSVFAGSPPSPSLMDEIMKLLLLLHKPSECYITHDRSKFYFLLTSQLPAKEKSLTVANFSRVAAPFRRNFGAVRPGRAVAANTELDANRVARIARLRKLHTRNSPFKRCLNEFEENLENVADCSKLNKSALRLLSPGEVSRWRLKFKAHANLPTSPKKSPNSSNKKRTTSPIFSTSSLGGSATQPKISHKRLRSHSASNARSLQLNEAGKRIRHATELNSEGSANSTSALSNTFDCDYSEGSAQIFNEVFSSTPSQRRSKLLVKSDFYSSTGIIALQEGLFTLLKDFLCLLPDNSVEDVLKHYVKVEFLLVLANHSSCAVRAGIIKLLAALTKRLSQNELATYHKNFYPQHLANQLAVYPTDAQMFEACIEWVSGLYGNLDSILFAYGIRIQNRFGLNVLLAITTKTIVDQTEFAEKAFKVLHRIYMTDAEEQQLLIEAGLLQCCIKALYELYSKTNVIYTKTEYAILELLTTVGERALKSVGQINIVWDILNLLSFYQEKQPTAVIRAFRSLQGNLQLNWISMFFGPTNVPWRFKVTTLSNSTLTLGETKTRLDLLIDRCSQFFTVFDANYIPSDNEVRLFQLLVSYGIATNQRCNNFIAWGLQPSRPRALRAFIVDALWISCQDDFLPAIICDGKMIKSLLWLSLLEDLDQPLENLERLCKRLGINENDSAWNLENELERIELNRVNVSAKQKSLLEKTIYKFESLAVNCIESSMVTTRRVAELQNAERKLLMNHLKDYDETGTYTRWLEIIRRMTHEGAPWYCKERSENSWELDDTEGPSRVHTRLRRCHLDMDKRFLMEDYRASATTTTIERNPSSTPTPVSTNDYVRPLDYLITSYDQQLNISLNSHILYNFPAKYMPVDGEIDGEIIVTDHKLYFLATYRCKYFYVTCDISNITEIWLKRHQHQEKAFEIFLDTNQSLFFSLKNQEDWKIMHDVFCDKIVTPPDQSKVLLITQQWREGLLTNWEYLMTLNQIAGRTYNDLMQYPVFPWILANYTGEVLDLTNANNFRKLDKPIAVQHEENEQHYINNYTYINNTMTNMGSMILQPYHYSSHYSNSGTVLHFLVRVPPFTGYFLRYQDNNFDIPDRTFHALNTTWSLASRDSPTDVKELIPEFFCLPEMFENFERFNFGCRQSGERVEDVALPPWCLRDPRLFVLIHRQALESEVVRSNLHQWIDLIFGFKQSGESAVEAINVFHPATYSVFLKSEISDPIERKAVETMVKTYGQMPRQLFKSPHAASKPLNYCLGDKEIMSAVRGLRWGVYLGSPQLPKPTLGNIYKLPGAEYLVAFNTNVVYGLPAKSCVMQGSETDTCNVVSWGYDDRIVRIQPLSKMYAKPKNVLYNAAFDDITACGTEPNSNQLWLGHKSGRISVYKCSNMQGGNRATIKSRQSYVRGLRLSYNSAFRKGTTKSGGGGGSGGLKATDDDVDGETAASSCSAGSLNSATDAALRDSADLCWSGPTVLMRHTDEITCFCLSVEFKIAVSAGRDGITVIWDLNNWSYIRTIERPAEIHHSPVTLIAISPTLGDIVTVHTIPWHNSTSIQPADNSRHAEQLPALTQPADECFEVTEESLDDFVNVSINPNGKSILRLHSVNARYVQHVVSEERILALCYSYVKEGVGVNVIATAVDGGIVRFWSSWNLSFVNEIVTGISNIQSITYSTHQHLVVLTKESHIQVWETEGLYGSSPKFPQIAYK